MKLRLATLGLLFAVVSSSAASVAVGTSSGFGAEPAGRSAWRELAGALASVVPPSLIRLVDGSQAISTGSDGRLTVLLLGSDTRGGGVSRTDTIMIMSLRGNSIAAVSIPRDTARIPNPDGGTFSPRINAILKQLKNGRTTQQALDKFEEVIEYVLQIEIDYNAIISFAGFEALVTEVEPISVRINREIKDSGFWDDPNYPSGVYFPEATGYELFTYQQSGNILCNGEWRTQGASIPQQYWCQRALPFVRSRKGPGNSDFARARRQQDFVVAAVRRVLNRGTGGNLNSLVNAAQGQQGANTLTTNIPLSGSNALDLFNKLNGASVSFQGVLSPPTYSTHIPGGTAFELNLPAVRQLMKQHFGSSGSPPPTPQPTPTTGPTATPTRAPTPIPTATPFRTPSPIPTATPFRTPSPVPTATLPPGVTPSPTVPGVTPGPTPTLPPGVTPAPTPTLPPGVTPAPTPTLAPGETPLPTPTLGPGQTVAPTPTLAPGQTSLPTPTGVAVLPSGATAQPESPGATGSPAGAVAPPSGNDPSQDGGDGLLSAANTPLLIAVGAIIALAAAALFVGWRRVRSPSQ